ncbi:hypothetical protein D3C77_452970 [compost metagenome]
MGKTPFAIKLWITGDCRFSTKVRSPDIAFCLIAPFPTMTSGFWLWLMNERASSIACGIGMLFGMGNTGNGWVGGFCAAMFSGNSIKTAPGFSICANLNALRMIFGMVCESLI